jgi:hypothetical protein
MKTVLQHIFHLKREYARMPFFDHLRDESLPAVDRLSFFPCMAPFILSFGDLNRFVMRSEPTSDPHQAMVNAHTYEDDHHWPWYLEDFVKLGHDLLRQSPSETMRFLWGEETVQSRLLAHRLAHLVWGATPVVRLAVLEAIEETGNVLFALTTELAKVVEADSGTELRYCGEFHFKLESGHAMNNDHVELARIELDAAAREDALRRVDAVFIAFTEWTHELLRFAQRRLEGAATGTPKEVPQLHNLAQLFAN